MSFAEALVLNYIERDGKLKDLKDSSPLMLAHIDSEYISEKRQEIRLMLVEMIKKHLNNYDI
jgi:hypothetical protein